MNEIYARESLCLLELVASVYIFKLFLILLYFNFSHNFIFINYFLAFSLCTLSSQFEVFLKTLFDLYSEDGDLTPGPAHVLDQHTGVCGDSISALEGVSTNRRSIVLLSL